MRILMPVFTVADWGGLHENALHSAEVLRKAGHEITFVCRDGRIAEAAKSLGLDVIVVDWQDWQSEADLLRETREYDLIFTQLQEARKFALEVKGSSDVPVIAQIQGFWSDAAHTWRDKVDAWIAVAPALTNLLAGFSKVEPWRISEIPNAVDTIQFLALTKNFEEKTAGGEARISLVSRLDADKRAQRDAAIDIVSHFSRLQPELNWRLDVYGDGPEKELFELELADAFRGSQNVSYDLKGWVDAEDVPQILANSFASVAAGRGALQSIVAGTPCFASGKFGNQGLQHGLALRIGLWSNFGDYPAGNTPAFNLESQVKSLLDPNSYVAIQSHGQAIVAVERDVDFADQKLIELVNDFS